jgi:hypothetical protein
MNEFKVKNGLIVTEGGANVTGAGTFTGQLISSDGVSGKLRLGPASTSGVMLSQVSGSLYLKNGDETVWSPLRSGAITVEAGGSVTASSFIKSGGTSSQFLKADGSVDSNTYITSGSLSTSLSAYVLKAGDTMSGILKSTYNSGSALSGFSVGQSVLGGLHFNNGAGPSNSRNQAAITFQGGTADNAQAGIYVLNDDNNGTDMAFATTENYGTGPQIGLRLTNNGTIYFNRYTTQGFMKIGASGLVTVDTNTYLTTSSASTTYQPIFSNVSTGLVKNTNGTVSYITDNSTNWNTAYGWGNHASGGYLTSASTLTAGNLSGTIPSAVLGNSTLYLGTTSIALNRASAAQSLTGITSIDGYSSNVRSGSLTNYNDVFATYTTQTDGVYVHRANSTATNLPATVNNANWVMSVFSHTGSYGHQIAGVDTDALYFRRVSNGSHQAWVKLWGSNDFTTTNVANWNTAYGWGNHASAGYAIATNYYTTTQIQNYFSGASAMTGYNKTNWDTAYGWGNHASGGYATASNTMTFTNKTWNGVAIADAYISSAATWNAKQAALSGTGLVKSTAGTITYTNGTTSQFVKGDGSLDSTTYLTSASGVSSITGTSNQVLVNGGTSAATGAVTLTLPQSIHTAASPTFADLTLTGNGKMRTLQLQYDHFAEPVYSYTNGMFIQTDIPGAADVMFELYITGNGYGTNPIDIHVQGYQYSTTGTIISTAAISKGESTNIEIFNYGGFLCFWLAQSGSDQTYRFRLSTFTGTSYKISSITNVVKPVSGTSKDVTVIPNKVWHSANDGSGSGLDADLLDGYNTATAATASTVVVRDGSGYIFGSYFNQNTANNENPTVSQFMVTNGGDNYFRKASVAHVQSALGLGSNAYTSTAYYPASNPNGYTTNTGTVTSVAMTVPTGLSIGGSPITTAGTLALSLTAGYSIPTTASQTTWNTAYTYSQVGHLPLAGGTLTGALTGTSGTFNNILLGQTSGTVATNVLAELRQTATVNQGLWITGREMYQSANGDNAAGVFVGLGVNRTDPFNVAHNRQMWMGATNAIGSSTLSVFRYLSGQAGWAGIDAVSGDGVNRLLTVLGSDTSNVGVGYDSSGPTTANYTAKLNVFTRNNSIGLLKLQQWGTASGDFITANTPGSVVRFKVDTNGAGYFNTGSQLSGVSNAKLTVVQTSTTADWVAAFKGGTNTNGSWGLRIDAGTSSTDEALGIFASNGSTQLFKVRGDGVVLVNGATNNSQGTLITNGDISPHTSGSFSLGTSSYRWGNTYAYNSYSQYAYSNADSSISTTVGFIWADYAAEINSSSMTQVFTIPTTSLSVAEVVGLIVQVVTEDSNNGRVRHEIWNVIVDNLNSSVLFTLVSDLDSGVSTSTNFSYNGGELDFELNTAGVSVAVSIKASTVGTAI